MELAPLGSAARQALRDAVGHAHFSDRREDLVLHAFDAMNRRFLPEAVVHPGGPEEVAEVLRLANRHGFAVVPRGAGTGFSGGSLAVSGGVVLTTARMNRILRLDPDNMTAWVEAGVVNGLLQDEADRHGLFFPPDPSSMRFSTVGGNAAENAGGPRAVKYGVTRDHVMALEVVLPTGEVIRTGSAAVKSVTGYDLTRLMVGSEGTLGVITKLLVRLLPKPEGVRTILASFPSIQTASAAVAAVMASRVIPATLEFMDRAAVECVKDVAPSDVPPGTAALLLIEVDGPEVAVGGQAERLTAVCRERGALAVASAAAREERERLWKVRRSLSPAILKLRPRKINEDVAVPRMRVPELVDGIEALARRHRLLIVNFGHAGDGNVHVNILLDPEDRDEAERAERAVEDLFRLVVGLEGTLSGEHGIGIAKAAYLGLEVDAAALEAMRRIKRALDPNNVLNPFKTFDYPAARPAPAAADPAVA